MSEQIQGYRLSPQQRRLWSLASSDTVKLRARVAVVVDGRLDLDKLGTSLRTLVARHEILRTNFCRLPGMEAPLQVVLDAAAPRLDLLPAVAGAATDLVTESIAAADAAVADDATTPVRSTLTPMGGERHLLGISVPALCSDATGLANLVSELQTTYAALVSGQEEANDEEAMQYSVVADWLNETLEADEAKAGVSFWRAAVGNASLPDDLYARAREGVFTPRSVPFALDADTTRALDEAARKLGVSPSSLMTAGWQALVWRMLGSSALPVAAVMDGRSADELSGAIGPLARHLPLVVAIDADTTVATLARRIHTAVDEGCAWQESFDGDVVLGVTSGRAPRFCPFAVEYRLGNRSHLAGDVTFTVVGLEGQSDRYAMLLSAVREAERTTGQLQYDPQRYSAAEATRVVARLQAVLRSMLLGLEGPVSDLTLLSADEERTLLVDFNDTQRPYDATALVHNVFTAQAARTPDRTAVVFADEKVSYRELDARSNQLARVLRARGVGRNVTVGLLMDRSIEMVVGIFGILKAGGAYIPLDAEYPHDRIAYMLADSQTTVLVTQARLLSALSVVPPEVICLDRDASTIASADAAPLPPVSLSEDLAYVLYTSGSTGRPKGVMIPHRALCNHMSWMQERAPLGEGDAVLQKTPFSFDASVWEFYAPLFAGARLVMAQPGGHRDTSYLRDVIVRERITTIQLVPTLLRMLLEDPGFGRCTSLTRVFCGGEVLSPDLRDRFHQISQGELINLYGPTETCIDATFHVCQRGEKTLPIGRPIANTQMYLLDAAKRPVPLGADGEIYIGGRGVGLGYLYKPELTAERFLVDSFRNEPGALLYRTGDLGRYLPDGSIEYRGRIDSQIKLRGHRIELGEVESTLGRHPQVSECVVVVREDQPGDARLAAYFVARPGEPPRDGELRQFLKASLPEYMVPSSFTKLPALPLLPNGKIDQRSLPVPAAGASTSADSFVAPRNLTERDVAAIWCEVLGVAKVGVHDDFFELGGHSLIATQLTSRIRKLFHVDVPLRELFAAPTVAGLAERIAKLQAELVGHVDMTAVLAELEGLSDEEARTLLTEAPVESAPGE